MPAPALLTCSGDVAAEASNTTSVSTPPGRAVPLRASVDKTDFDGYVLVLDDDGTGARCTTKAAAPGVVGTTQRMECRMAAILAMV